MYRPLPIMFIASLLAATAAWAEPQGHDSRYPQQGGGRYERGAGEASHQQGRPVEQARPMPQSRPMQQTRPMERGDRGGGGGGGRGGADRGGGDRGGGDRGVGGFRGADNYRGGDRGPIGQVYTPRNSPAPQSREPARDGGSRYDRGVIGNVANARPGNDRRDYGRPGNDRPGNDRPGFANGRDRYDRDRNDHDRYHDQGRDHSRYAGWTRDRDDWRDERGHSWHHDGDWYQRYHYDHFRWYDNRFFARQRFSIGFYYAPWGYAPRVWGYGDRLPLSYYSNRYLIDDYYNYDLYAPPYGTSWVRVGDDVLLVDLDTGEVLDSIASLFW